MPSNSPRNAVRAGIVVVATMCFLLGIFLMLGIQEFLRRDPIYLLSFVVIPLLVIAAVLNASRILKTVP